MSEETKPIEVPAKHTQVLDGEKQKEAVRAVTELRDVLVDLLSDIIQPLLEAVQAGQPIPIVELFLLEQFLRTGGSFVGHMMGMVSLVSESEGDPETLSSLIQKKKLEQMRARSAAIVRPDGQPASASGKLIVPGR